MEMIFCPNCGQLRGFKRALGFGTLFMVLITFGLWLLMIPLYPARCIACGLTRGSAFWENLRSNPRGAITFSSVVAVLVCALFVVSWFSKSSPDNQLAPIYKGPNYNEIGSPGIRLAIERALKDDEDTFCSETQALNCRPQFRNGLNYKSIVLTPNDGSGLIVELCLQGFEGSGGCTVEVLRKANAGYESVLNAIGGVGDWKTDATTTNGYYNLIQHYSAHTETHDYTYIWTGTKYETRSDSETQSPSESQGPVENIVSASTLSEFPKLYQHKYVEFVGWENALVESAASAKAESSQPLSLPADCKFVLHFLEADGANAFGCAENVPVNLLNPSGAASEENIELYCEVEGVNGIGIFLKHCKLSPSEYVKRKEQEHELEQSAPSR